MEMMTMKKDQRKKNLKFVNAGENTYRVFNTRKGRFHNLELGIDEVR